MTHLITLILLVILFNILGVKDVEKKEIAVWVPTMAGISVFMLVELLYWLSWVYF